MANPSGTGASNNDTAHPSHQGGNSVPEHNPGGSTDWTPDEQLILEDGLSQYASESNIIRYAKIAVQLQNKTVRDVALRCRWMIKRDISKRRKEDYMVSRKSKDRKEKITDLLASTSYSTTQTGGPSYVQGVVPSEKPNAMLHSVLDSSAGQLLKQNAQAFERISANLETRQVHENVGLFCQARENILSILNNLNEMPEKLKLMPPLPVELNEELVNSLLPHTALPMQQLLSKGSQPPSR